ncbi:MAG TPA: tetratricopeptide repeat protein, partial [Chitinophagaceae bacterium]|nr:tetratricopeptide repeat protein [Chitinophagaceae bacterium]
SRGPIYRPTSLAIFAIIWEFAPNNPKAFHFVNVFLYALTCLLLFLILCRLFKDQDLLIAFTCALLYSAHPIHTEVVNSIKSMDEILCFLFGLSALWFVLNYVSTKSKASVILGSICFFLSLISKETGVTFLLATPMTVFFFADSSLKKTFLILLGLSALTGIWLVIRMMVFKDLPPNTATTASILNNTLNAAPDKISRFATAFYILLRYIVLLAFPYRLRYDYSYAQINIQTLANPGAWLGIIVVIGALIYALFNIRKKSVVAYGILFFFITLAPVSNVFFPVAATMAERFMYIPSFGFCLILSYFLIRITNTKNIQSGIKTFFQFVSVNYKPLTLVFAISVLYVIRTTTRNGDWQDNLTLFSHDVKITGNSARANQTFGSALMLAGMSSKNKKNQTDTFNLAKIYLQKALDIYPDFYSPLSHLGVIYLFENKIDSAYSYLKKGIEIMPNDVDLNFNLGLSLFHLKKYDEAISVLAKTIRLAPNHEKAYYNLAALYQNTGDYDKAISNYLKVLELNPNNPDAYYNYGIVLRSKGDTAGSNQFIQKARSLGYKTN